MRISWKSFVLGLSLILGGGCRGLRPESGLSLSSLLQPKEFVLGVEVMVVDLSSDGPKSRPASPEFLEQIAHLVRQTAPDVAAIRGMPSIRDELLRAYLPGYGIVGNEALQETPHPSILLYRQDRLERDLRGIEGLPVTVAGGWRMIEKASRKTFLVLDLSWFAADTPLPPAAFAQHLREGTQRLRQGKEPMIVFGHGPQGLQDESLGEEWLNPHRSLSAWNDEPSRHFILCERRRCRVGGAEILQSLLPSADGSVGRPYTAKLELHGTLPQRVWRLAQEHPEGADAL